MYLITEKDIDNRNIPVICTGVNYDYVLLLKKDGDKFIVLKKYIRRSMNLLQRISDIVASDYSKVEDLMKLTAGLPLMTMNYSFCSLSGSYVLQPFIPDMSKNIMGEYMYDYGMRDCIELNYHDSLKVFNRDFEKYYDKHYQYLRIIDKDKYVQKKMELKHKLQLKWENYKKYRYSQYIMRYIYALDYDTAIKEIDDDTTVVAYSHEKIGYKYGSKRYPLFQKQMSDDVELSIHTNFCYGDSSYFYVAIKYKGVMICPYSAWVRFYHARYNEIMDVTRQYDLTRENWERCFYFVADFVNMSISDPERFVRELIVKEVVNLRIGLEKIFTMSTKEVRKRMTVQGQKADSYLGIKNLSVAKEIDIDEYDIQGEDMVFIWKMEKIAHAANFIDGLKAFEEISEEINTTVDFIIKQSLSIKDAVSNKIYYLSSFVNDANDSLSKEQEENRQMLRLSKELQRDLDKRIRRKDQNTTKENVYKQFVYENPDFEELNVRLENSNNHIETLLKDIRRNRKYISRLEEVNKSIQLLESKIK